jgi:hypothetical protein
MANEIRDESQARRFLLVTRARDVLGRHGERVRQRGEQSEEDRHQSHRPKTRRADSVVEPKDSGCDRGHRRSLASDDSFTCEPLIDGTLGEARSTKPGRSRVRNTNAAVSALVRGGISCPKGVHQLEVAVENMPLSGWYLAPSTRNRWKRCFTTGQKFLISPFGPTPPLGVWHSINRSSRSTCRREREPKGDLDREGRGASQEERIPSNGQRSSVRSSVRRMTWSASRQTVVCPTRTTARCAFGNPEGRVSFDSLVTRGFRPFGLKKELAARPALSTWDHRSSPIPRRCQRRRDRVFL